MKAGRPRRKWTPRAWWEHWHRQQAQALVVEQCRRELALFREELEQRYQRICDEILKENVKWP